MTFLLGTVPTDAQVSSATSTLRWKTLTPPTTEELVKKGPKVAVETAAEVLGMVRGVQRTTTAVNTLEFVSTGSISELVEGTWQTYTEVQITEAVDFVIPAVRVEIQRAGLRNIQVLAGKRAWDEEMPGINGTPVTAGMDDRLRQIWLTPHGAMWGALRAAESNGASVANDGGRVAIGYSMNGESIKIILNPQLLPDTVQIQAHSSKYGNTVLEANYSQYKDFEGYLLQCPSRVIYRAAGRTVRDVTVTKCTVNPYIVFPIPSNMSKAVAAK